jgi:uncharacterized membrane protein YkvA (DUF1232 family)
MAKINILEILTSKLFKNLLGKAGRLIGKKNRLLDLSIQVAEKVATVGGVAAIGTLFLTQIKLLGLLAYHYATGRYTKIKTKSIVIIVGVLLYFVLPLDLIPDFLPAVGYLDDITLVGWLFTTLSKELDLFKKWLTTYSKAEEIKFKEIP